MNINIDTSNIDLVHNPDILVLVLKSLPKAHIVHVEFFDGDTYEFVTTIRDTLICTNEIIGELGLSEFTSFVQGKNPKYENACYIDFSQTSPEQNIKSQDISLNRAMHAKPGELLHIGNKRIIACDGFFIDLDNDLQQLSQSQIATMLFLNDTPSTNLKKLFS